MDRVKFNYLAVEVLVVDLISVVFLVAENISDSKCLALLAEGVPLQSFLIVLLDQYVLTDCIE